MLPHPDGTAERSISSKRSARPARRRALPRESLPKTLEPRHWIEHLALHAPIALEGRDPEGVHQVRVAAGRLSIWLQLTGVRVLRDDLRWLRRSAAAVRDLDVLLESPQPAPFAHWLEQERAQQRAGLIEVLTSPRLTALLEALSSLATLHRRMAASRLDREVTKLLRRGRRAARAGATLEEIHALRRSVRRVRYGREWLGRKSRGLERLQGNLGVIADAAAALGYLDRCPPWEGALELRTRMVEELERSRATARKRFDSLAQRLALRA
jgi:CHAD domain-containing protein